MSPKKRRMNDGATINSEKITTLELQVENLRSENEHLTSENESLKISTLERQVETLRSENERLTSQNKSLKQDLEITEPSPGQESTPTPDHLGTALNHVRDVASKLNITLREPNQGNEFSVLCGVVSQKWKLTSLKCFFQEYSGLPEIKGRVFCLEQISYNYAAVQDSVLGKDLTRCPAHERHHGECVWVSKRGSGWIVGSGRLSSGGKKGSRTVD
ncbi:uncharacterized protein FIESC28_04086 [Fusarium coffeatum]|uniref:Uncharacterized protein n=1 Tax=Fusarium coffeatum TaxID=231269 RepID=A0A366S1B5_9HYPO|nr:uncharacterized protein FIESC28_04086 [Fusarium coffeatum]RBR23091.1 hypothetical protein FIESC28_04086 [Fusarium coffeatum]